MNNKNGLRRATAESRQQSPNSDPDQSKEGCPLQAEHRQLTAIYPVRYAYGNFFEPTLSSAAMPPSLPSLMAADSISAGQGYLVRLLRKGWIYIREEGGSELFHIFKYEPMQVGEGEMRKAIESYVKYSFSNGIDARGGLKKEGRDYPFVFVGKDVTDISIAYSEHQWSASVIENLRGNAQAREHAMQRINLPAVSSQHSVAATTSNLSELVEDFKERKKRFLQLKGEAGTLDPDLASVDLSYLTTQDAYYMQAQDIAAALQKNQCYADSARIVALYDPVGRQKEIAQAHGKLVLWQQHFSAANIYPLTIGGFVNSLKNSPDEAIREAVEENINLAEHREFWGLMSQDLAAFKARQQAFANLYRAFMTGSEPAQTGGLASYFKYYFSHEETKPQSVEQELQKLLEVSTGMFEGVLASVPAKQAMEMIMADAAEQSADPADSTNAYDIVCELLRTLVTQPQADFDWSITTVKAMDKLLVGLGPLWGESVALLKFGVDLAKRGGNKLTFNALKYTVEQLIPKILNVYGLKISANKVTLTHDELAKVIAKVINASTGVGSKTGQTAIEAAQNKMQRGQLLFDWAETTGKKRLPHLLDLSEVEVMRASGERFSFLVPENNIQRIGLLFDTGFAGLSAYFNIMTIVGISSQTGFDKANPLQQGRRAHTAAQLTASISALTVDLVLLGRSGLVAGEYVVNQTGLARALAPALIGRAEFLGRFLVSKVATGLIAVANLAGAISAIWDSVHAYRQGNTGETVGHVMIAAGSAVLFASAAKLLIAGGVISGSGAGLPIGIAVAAIGLLLGGIAMVFYFKKTPLELLLSNCFWGKSKTYLFWDQSLKRSPLPNRLEDAREINQQQTIHHFFRLELQEFLNFFNMPKLEIEGKSFWLGRMGDADIYTYTFTLPNFQPGISELRILLYSPAEMDFNTGFVNSKPNEALTRDFTQKIDNQSIRLDATTGTAIIKVRFSSEIKIKLYWYYLPQPDVMVPMRILSEQGELKQQFLIGMMDEEPR